MCVRRRQFLVYDTHHVIHVCTISYLVHRSFVLLSILAPNDTTILLLLLLDRGSAVVNSAVCTVAAVDNTKYT